MKSEVVGIPIEGVVKWFNDVKGFGFILPTAGVAGDIFVHWKHLITVIGGRRTLIEGERVSFVLVQTDKGPAATEVRRVGLQTVSMQGGAQ